MSASAAESSGSTGTGGERSERTHDAGPGRVGPAAGHRAGELLARPGGVDGDCPEGGPGAAGATTGESERSGTGYTT